MTTFGLKILALLLMVVDHIGLFFPCTPICFRWLGRLSAPLFIFCTIYGFSYTRDRKKYLIRMYLFGAGMAIMDFILNCFSQNVLVENNIFVTLFCISIIISLIDYKRKNHPKWKVYLFCFFIWQSLSLLLCCFVDWNFDAKYTWLVTGFMGNIFCNEGRLTFVLLGVILYLAKDKKKNIVLSYSCFCTLYSSIIISDFFPRVMQRLNHYGLRIAYDVLEFILLLLGFSTRGIFLDSVLYKDFEWMMIGALPFMILYNGKRGKKVKYFFYIFYPAHILIMFILNKVFCK